MKNYKNIRQKPYIYGFSVQGFFVFAVGTIFSLLIFIAGFSLLKLIIAGFFIIVFYGIGKFVLSSSELIQKIFDNKLPKKYSKYE